MPDYRFRGKDLEALTREELIEALRQALDLLRQHAGDPAPVPFFFSHDQSGTTGNTFTPKPKTDRTEGQ